ncbi:phage tail sheath protein [Clostridium sp. 'deep sea']|uniref:phage tail sheath C-terminal domain-containing protein n=1 Tax=Clostridium sp. 'deep sea' TaxID=2779445 RepID=UPI001896864D|nr:phage tail sheath C-terminal domain-containing protein [Clostridium sp. 'deep sea']QOR36655.1 phage tail sheath protein [Clostridium sp. 'deep sea']
MANVGLPKINIKFSGLGSSAVQRGQAGVACLIVKDSTDTSFKTKEYRSISDLTSTEAVKFTADNLQLIKDCLSCKPNKLIVFRMNTDSAIADTLNYLATVAPMAAWLAVASSEATDQKAVADFVVASNKCYKALVYKVASDNMHVVNFTNEKVNFNDSRAEQNGDKAVPYILGYLAGLPNSMSAIAKKLNLLSYVQQPANIEESINNGEFVLINDEKDVMVARGVNSLTTTGAGVTDDMKFIHVVEIMDLIYTDIYSTWKNFYKGKYPNSLDNQMLVVSALNTYFKKLADDNILDSDYENKVVIDTNKQRLANTTKYGQDEVALWSEDKLLKMTVGTSIYLKATIKILNIQEDIELDIIM